jgi:DUF917 family protein
MIAPVEAITVDALDDLAVGATVLGTGGGDPYMGTLMARQGIDQYGPVRLLPTFPWRR